MPVTRTTKFWRIYDPLNPNLGVYRYPVHPWSRRYARLRCKLGFHDPFRPHTKVYWECNWCQRKVKEAHE